MKIKDKTGERYGRLTIVKFSHREIVNGNYRYYWWCKCDCGTKKIVGTTSFPRIKSCGCLGSEARTTHGMSKSGNKDNNFYLKWRRMKQQCLNPNNRWYCNYGAKGITISKRWIDFVNFKEDMYESYLEYIKDHKNNIGLYIKNKKKGYSKSNCYWSSKIIKIKKIKYEGEETTIGELSKKLGLPARLIYNRYKMGYTNDDLNTEKNHRRKSILSKVNKIKVGDISHLSKRNQKIIKYRCGVNQDAHTLEDTGSMFKMTRERVRQICKKYENNRKKVSKIL